jgi:acetyl-CoA C-acetyltransferase
VSEVILGNVIGSNQGQAPARQAAVKGGLPHSVVCTTVNKVCSSGMKSVMYGAMGIQLGHHQTAVTGGFESMSNIPYYVPAMRNGAGYGHTQMVDGILRDGLMDAFDDHHMGNCAEKTAKDFKLTRADQDAYALESYRRSSEAQKAGHFKAEITPVELPGAKKGEAPKLFQVDEEPSKLKADKVPTLRPAFLKDGTVTAANSSKLNDGASALVLSSDAFAASRGLKPLARVVGTLTFFSFFFFFFLGLPGFVEHK